MSGKTSSVLATRGQAARPRVGTPHQRGGAKPARLAGDKLPSRVQPSRPVTARRRSAPTCTIAGRPRPRVGRAARNVTAPRRGPVPAAATRAAGDRRRAWRSPARAAQPRRSRRDGRGSRRNRGGGRMRPFQQGPRNASIVPMDEEPRRAHSSPQREGSSSRAVRVNRGSGAGGSSCAGAGRSMRSSPGFEGRHVGEAARRPAPAPRA